MKRYLIESTDSQSSEELSDNKMSTNEIELWVRFEDETDEQAHLVPVNKTGFVAHLQRAVAEKLNIDEMTIKSIALNNTVLSTRTKLDSLDCTNGTFVICKKDSKSEEKIPSSTTSVPVPSSTPPTPTEDEPSVPKEEVEDNAGTDQDDDALFEDTRKLSPQVLFDIPSGEDSIDIPYRCIDHKSIQILRMPLSTTLAELKAIIAKHEGVELTPNENDKLEVDLHVWSHPLVYHKRTENLSLGRLGFRELLSKQDDDDENAFDNRVIYVVFRTLGSLTQKQEWAQFDNSPSWSPCRHRQSPIGMMQFLSALYVLTHSLESDKNEANHFLGHLCYLTRFPPAILAFYYLMKNKKIYAEQKAALSNTLYYLFRQLVPRQSCPDDSKLFENALKCFGYLLTEGHQEYSIDSTKFEVITLTCPLNFSAFTDPVRVKSSKRNRVYNRKSLVDRMPGGSMFMDGTPFANLTMDMLIPDIKTKLLLLSHPLNDEIIVLNNVKEDQSLSPPRMELSFGEWTKLIAKVTVTAKILHITPPLALRTAAAPALTRDEKGQICVYTGPEPCSVGTVILHNTVTLQNKRVRPDDLAKALGHRGESVDDREVLEAIMVCLDTSGSMDDFSFTKDDNEDEKIRIELTMEEAERELKIFQSSECLTIYKRLYRMDPKGVMEEIASQGMLMQNLVEAYGNRLVRILLDPFQVAMLDVRMWPENSNYLQWLPDSLLQVIYQFVLELPDITEKTDKEPYQLPPPKNPITISIRSLKGTSWNFEVDKTFTVLQIKRALEPTNDRPSLRLIYNGKVLEDDKMLGFYGIKDQDLIIVIWSVAAKKTQKEEVSSDDDSASALDISSEEQEDLVIVTERDYQEHNIHIDSTRSLEYLRLQLWEELGLKPSEHSLWQGFQDVDGWGERAYVDENGIVESLFENTEKVYYGPRERKKADPRLTRLETVKQLFHAFINRSQAYDYPNHIGLILFNTTIRQACALTPLFEVFRDHIDKAYANGGTNLYGATAKAAEILSSFKITHPKAHLRIVCFTDGEDTLKTIDPEMCAKMMRANGVILDAIMIGEGKDNHILRAMAKSTGGYAFAPQTLTEALNINELETMLSVSERPIFEIDAQFNQVVDLVDYAQLEKYPLNVCNREVVPSRKMPEELTKPVVSLKNAVDQATESIVMDVDEEVTLEQNQNTNNNNQSEAPAAAILEKQRTRRILKELRFLLKEPHPNFDVYPNSSNIGFWQIVMEVDPEGSHYSGGTWLLYAEFPPDYPSRAPEIRFVTPIRHSNVNQYGKICHSIFTRNWTADTNMQTVFNCIYGLMLNPDTDDPLDTNLALSFFSATGDYEAKIMAHVEKFAKQKDRDAWRNEFEQTNDPSLQ